MAMEFKCERDGVVIRGEDDAELMANVQAHVADAHPDLVRAFSREQILAAAKEA